MTDGDRLPEGAVSRDIGVSVAGRAHCTARFSGISAASGEVAGKLLHSTAMESEKLVQRVGKLLQGLETTRGSGYTWGWPISGWEQVRR